MHSFMITGFCSALFRPCAVKGEFMKFILKVYFSNMVTSVKTCFNEIVPFMDSYMRPELRNSHTTIF